MRSNPKIAPLASLLLHQLQGLTCCVIRDALLHTPVVTCGLSDCCLPVSLNQPFFSHIPHWQAAQNCCSLDIFAFHTNKKASSVNSGDCCAWESQEIICFWVTQTTLSGTTNHSIIVTMVTFLPQSDVLSEQLNWCHMHACMLWVATIWLDICINKQVYRST